MNLKAKIDCVWGITLMFMGLYILEMIPIKFNCGLLILIMAYIVPTTIAVSNSGDKR